MNHRARSAQAPSLRTAAAPRLSQLLRARGTGAPSLRLLAIALLALAGFLALSASPAFAARGHEFKESLGTPCTPQNEPCAPGTLKEPVAVGLNEESGDLYVADRALKRVTVLNSSGALVSEITGPSASGTGDVNLATGSGDLATLATGTGRLRSGTKIVTEVTTSTGAFAVGESISAPGIPPGTTITEIEGEALTLSAAVEEGGTATGVELTSGSKTISNVTGSFSVGTPIFGNGIPVGTTITALGAGTLTISRGVTAAGSGVTLEASNVTNVNTATGAFVPGEEITAPGIPSGATIEAVAPGELTLSKAATATEPAAALAAHQDFSEPDQLAIDNACARQEPPLTGGECEAFDPSAGDVYVVSGEPRHWVIDKFTASGEFLGQITGFTPGHHFNTQTDAGTGVAVDGGGRLWVAGEDDIYEGSHFREGVGVFDNALANQPTQFFPIENYGGLFRGFALAPAGGFYLHTRFFAQFVTEFGPAGGQVAQREFEASQAPTGLATDPVSGDLYVSTGATVQRFAPNGLEAAPLETLAVPAAGHGAGLTLDTASDLYLADSTAGAIDLFVPQQPAKPTVESLSLSDVSGDSATLQAEINPRGEPTSYRFEYGPCETPSTCASSPYDHTAPVPDGSVGEDFEAHPVSIHPQGLQPGAAYHFRILATNPLGTGEAEKAFTTQPAGGSLLLPDNRQWEMVSPPNKRAGLIQPLGIDHVTQAAAAGSAVSYTASATTEADPEGNSNQDQLLSARGPAGWSSRDLASPHQSATGLAQHGQEYPFFSTDLSAAVLQPSGAFTPQLSPAGSEQTAYLRTDFPPASPTAFCTAACYRPLVTGCPAAGECPAPVQAAADVPPGTVFGLERGGRECGISAGKCGPLAVGATPDLSHLALEYANAGLTATPGDQGGLYEWSAAAPSSEQLQLLSVLPDGQPAPSALEPGLGSASEFGPSKTARGAISPDGSRVFFSTNNGEYHLYLRLNALQPQSPVEGSAVDGTQCTEPAKACTIQLDALQGGSGAGTPGALFQLATADGSRAFFTDSQALTADAGEGEDLYEYDLQRPPAQRLADLTPKGSSGESAQVNSYVIGASADASYLYFAASGALGTAAGPGKCNGAAASDNCNLYLLHDGVASLIAPLSAAGDKPSLGGEFQSASLTARVSPDGRWLAFMSQRPLTGYDNRDALTGRPDQEVFLYHAPAGAGEEGKLTCASCNPTGARPRGARFGDLVEGIDGRANWQSGQGIAASLPSWTPYNGAFPSPRYQPRYLSNGGRLFFNAVDSLVPQDSNHTGDVYQYEPPASEGGPPGDTCTTSTPTYSPASQGCVDLISSGTSAEESGFLDASETGGDVFFFTGARLSGQDVDTARDVYDAHACSAESPCPPPPPPAPPACAGDACQNPATPPNDATPSSLTFQGAGNLLQCPKGKVRRSGRCVARKHHKAKHRKKAHRRAARSKRGSK